MFINIQKKILSRLLQIHSFSIFYLTVKEVTMATKQYKSTVNYVGAIKRKKLSQYLIKQDVIRHMGEWRQKVTHS